MWLAARRSAARHYPERYDLSRLAVIRSIREFDDAYTAPSAGFGTAANYYARASSLERLGQIAVPTLLVQAQDDPFIPFGPYPIVTSASPRIRLLAPRHGGHVGFLQANPEPAPFDRFWAENRVVEFCQELASSPMR